MGSLVGAAPLRQAAERFRAFFHELELTFVEREDVLRQIALGLLSRQHVLMTGPPGTAKSQLAHAVLGRIVSKETGRSSLFSRQFTESTVQTDLVGPIDFKTLMESGRTEHFTDEGILGAAHAFLDEVFDGRDMLLRSTLNLLQERELKQGAKVTTGKIECAIMTSNRYLAEILDNERLVAFVDRIAFLCFVPKGFGTPNGLETVLAAQVAGLKPPPLSAPLTIEDLDVLQAAADGVYVDESICTALAAMIHALESELAAARRADPTFVPSRYLSTRTAVRMGSLLRAVCLLDCIGRGWERPLEVRHEDLAGLRFGLILCGPDPVHMGALLQKETDPRERRQLAIVRAEREIFDRCLAALPPPAQVPRPREVPAALLGEAAPAALAVHGSGKLLELSRALALAASSGQRGAADAQVALQATLQALVERALRSGLGTGGPDTDPVTVAAALAELAGDVERAGRTHARAARWLRGCALDAIDHVVRLGAAPMGEAMVTMLTSRGDLSTLGAFLDTALGRLERLHDLHEGLRHAGADEKDPAACDRHWKEAAERIAAALGPVLRAELGRVGEALLAAGERGGGSANVKAGETEGDGDPLGRALAALAPALELARAAAARVARLGADGEALRAAVLAPLVTPVARRAYHGALAGPREARLLAFERRTAKLGAAGLLSLLRPEDVMRWCVEALLRAPDVDAMHGPAPSDGRPADAAGYRRLRTKMPRGTLASLLIDVYLKVVPGRREDLLEPDRVVGEVAALVGKLRPETAAQLARVDLTCLEVPVAYLERWWKELAASLPGAPAAALQALASARFLDITHDEAALARFALEARLVARVLDAAGVAPLLERIEALERVSNDLAQRLLAACAGDAGPETSAEASPGAPDPGDDGDGHDDAAAAAAAIGGARGRGPQ